MIMYCLTCGGDIYNGRCLICGMPENVEEQQVFEIKVVNLTPHELNIQNVWGQMETIAPAATSARVSETRVALPDQQGDFNVTRAEYGEVEGLPEPQPDTIYIVSEKVLQRVFGRTDVFSPGPLLRDKDGKVIGCVGLTAPAEAKAGEKIEKSLTIFSQLGQELGDEVKIILPLHRVTVVVNVYDNRRRDYRTLTYHLDAHSTITREGVLHNIDEMREEYREMKS